MIRSAVTAAAVGLLVTGCGTPAGGDPGGRRLAELAADRVLAATPPGTTGIHVTRTPARYRRPAFQTAGWDGPSVVVTFRSSTPAARVFGFYARRATAAGWRPTSTGSLGLTDAWTKTYPDGARATLLLSLLTRGRARERDYQLSAGVAPVP